MQRYQCLLGLIHGLKCLQANGVSEIDRADPSAAQGRQMGAATQTAADVLCQRPDVSALTAIDQQTRLPAVEVEQLQAMDGHRPRGAVQSDPLPGKFIEGFAVPLEG